MVLKGCALSCTKQLVKAQQSPQLQQDTPTGTSYAGKIEKQSADRGEETNVRKLRSIGAGVRKDCNHNDMQSFCGEGYFLRLPKISFYPSG